MNREAQRLARQIALNLIREPFRSSGPELVLAPEEPADWERRKVLPPFLGEMGFEIRYFLAAVEPWLRSGWRVPAKRPEYYPPGAGFADKALFAELNGVLDEAGAKPLGGSVVLLGGSGGGYLVGASIEPNGGLSARASCPDPEETKRSVKAALLEQALRRTFARHHGLRGRPVTPWDNHLTSVFDARAEHLCGGPIALAPTYKPDGFVNPAHASYPHVGVQFRSIPHNAPRNSNVARLLADATAAAAHLGVPLLVYGHPVGTVRPEGLPNTFDLAAGHGLLGFELAMLRDCRVMFAPESGWCDLMCWLQVPTILESLTRPHTFSAMSVFRPLVILRNSDQTVDAQLAALLDADMMMPRAVRVAGLYDDLDWDGTWITEVMQEFISG